MIPLLDLTRQYREIRPEIDRAIGDVLAGGRFINGKNVAALEEEIAEYVGVRYAVGVNSGTDALHLALHALDIGPGDEVITTPFSFVATSEAIVATGARVVFADIDPATFNIDPLAVRSAITPRTRAIVPVHLYGRPAPMENLLAIARAHGLAVVEDCAQAIGASANGRQMGSLGTAGALSFFPSKNLGAYGDGGMVVTGDRELAERIRRLRVHGSTRKYHHDEVGVNSRLDELQAAILRVKLGWLETWTERRRAIAARYASALAELPGLTVPPTPADVRHVYHQFTVRVESRRDRLAAALHQRGVQTAVYYPVPLHLQRVHASLGLREGDFPHSETVAGEVLSLPIFPELREHEIESVVEGVASEVTADLCAS
jgi:dTDP-4-amino-4,6-dideoxygalactose transaminase